LLHEGTVKPESLVWSSKDHQWQELKLLPEYQEIIVAAPHCDHESTVIAKALREEIPAATEEPQVVSATQTPEDICITWWSSRLFAGRGSRTN
jgi:hypothetical protein